MADTYRYYAVLLDEEHTRERPLAVLRRKPFETGGGQDEIFTPGSGWRFTPILIEADHGDLTYDFVEIGEAEALQLVRSLGG